MQVAAILISDELRPTEVQAWLDANPAAVISHVVVQHDIFYVFYN